MNYEEESDFLKRAIGTQRHRLDVAAGGQRPPRLLDYWGWLVTQTHTEAIEFLLALLSVWYFIIVLGLLAVEASLWSPLVVAMHHIISIQGWAVLLLVSAFTSIFGLAFRVGVLRVIGLIISVGFWLTISGVTAYLQFYSPAWGGYAIIGIAASWACIRTVWETTDRLADWLRGKLEAGGHVRSNKH